MSGVVEGILIDIGDPELEESTENILINTTESVELMREEQPERRNSITLISPLTTEDRILHDVTDTFNKSNNNSVLRGSPLVTLDDETFDFDLPVTPVTSSDRSGSIEDEADEEVFFGPVGYMERCVATAVSSVHKETKPLSPLNSRQIAEICKEANAVAARISSAAGSKKRRGIAKEQLFCSKQLNLDKTPCIFSPKAVGKLLKAVSSRTDNTDEKENEMLVDSPDGSNKLNCDSLDSEKDKTNSVGNLPLLDISGVTEIVNERKSDSSEEESSKKRSDDSAEMTPSRRHNRSGTYTISKVPHEKLPVDKRRSLPVVGNADNVKNLSDVESISSKTNSASKTSHAGGKDKEGKDRKSFSKLKQPASKLIKPKTGIPAAPGVKKTAKTASPNEESSQSKPTSRLAAPKAGVMGKEGSLLPSKLKMQGSSSTGIPSKTTQQIPQKSGIPGLRGKPAGNGNAKPVPVSKLQLMKPGAIQKTSLAASHNKANEIVKKTGPMKAFVPAAANKETVPATSTPAKEEKCVQPRNLSANFNTPQRSGSVSRSSSSIDSPASSVQKRRSFLPTPNKSRTGSSGSIPSPCPSKNNSVFSNNSRGSSMSDSPSLNGSVNRGRKRQPSGNKYSYLDNINDNSPSAMKPKRQLVTNTPNMPRKKISPWSPINKSKPVDLEEQAIMCTKKLKK